MITINQYFELLTNFFKQHFQINTVKADNEFDFNADSDIEYKVAHVEFVTQSINNATTTHQFQITVADIFDPNLPESENEIYNDCNLIADDCITYFANLNSDDFDVNETVSIQKFTNGNVDRVAGVTFVLSFVQARAANACILPIESNFVNPANNLMYYGAFDGMPTWDDVALLDKSTSTSATLNTGLNHEFLVAVLQGYSIQRILDTSASDLELTALYENQGTVTSDDNLVYDLYIMVQAVPYSSNHKHAIQLIKE